ncbi:MAG: FtsQ-type POTRA domain-containing protein [Thermoleophilia bacterium]|nr:FtsQ-type POTRA domain-containing protein [Thermoleophilia bacterium]
MDRKIRDRREAVSRRRGRRRASLIFVLALLVAAAVLFVWLRSSDVFAVRTVTATVTERVAEDEVSRVAGEAIGASLLRLSTDDLEDALLALPYVRSAEVYRRFPNTLDVRLEEYEPVARLQAGDGAVWLVAENGRALEVVVPPRGAGLPLVVPSAGEAPVAGQQVSEVVARALPLAVLMAGEEADEHLASAKDIRVSASGAVTIVLKGGTELRLGDLTNLEQKLKAALQIIDQRLRDGERLEYVDVTVPDKLAVKAK